MNIILAVPSPSPSPTSPYPGIDNAVEHPGFWLVILGLIVFIVVVRAVNKWLGWGPRGDQ